MTNIAARQIGSRTEPCRKKHGSGSRARKQPSDVGYTRWRGGGIGSIYRGKRLSLLPGLAMAACFRHTRRPVVAVFAVAIHLASPDVLWLLLHLGGEENMEEAAGAESVTMLDRATSSTPDQSPPHLV